MCAWLHVTLRLYSFIVRRVDYFLKLLYFGISTSTAFSYVFDGGSQVRNVTVLCQPAVAAPPIRHAATQPPPSRILF